MRGNRNLEVFIKIIILLALAGLLIYELLSGKIYYYVHPRYLPGLWIAVAVLLLFALSMIREGRKGRHNSSLRQYPIYLLPIILALLFPVLEGGNGNIAIAGSNGAASGSYDKNSEGSQDTVSTKENTDGNGGTDSENTEGTANSSDEITDGTGDINNETVDNTGDVGTISSEESWQEPEDKSKKYQTANADGTIVISDDEYAGWYYDLFDYLGDFTGKKYQFTAQVFSMEGLKDNQFLAGRYIMTCCAVDLLGYGLICDYEKNSIPKENEWLTVTGTVTESEYNGRTVPILTDVVISKTEPPKEEYVYYYY